MHNSELLNAAIEGDGERLRETLQNPEINPLTLDEEGNTVLMSVLAGEEGIELEVIDILLEAGIDINAQNRRGETALILAVQPCTADVTVHLIERGAHPNIADYTGGTALMAAVAGGDYDPDLETIQALLEAGADPYAEDQNGDDTFALAEMAGDEQIIKLLENYAE